LIKEKGTVIVGIGRTGSGKSSLFKNIFNLDKRYNNLDLLNEVTRMIFDSEELSVVPFSMFSINVRLNSGYDFEYNEISILNSFSSNNPEVINMKNIIHESNVSYYVINFSNRDFSIDIENIKILYEGHYKEFVIILNMVDRLLLDPSEEEKYGQAWNIIENKPSPIGEQHLEKKITSLLSLLKQFGISEDQLVICSARRNYNLDKVLEKLLQFHKGKIDAALNTAKDEYKNYLQKYLLQERPNMGEGKTIENKENVLLLMSRLFETIGFDRNISNSISKEIIKNNIPINLEKFGRVLHLLDINIIGDDYSLNPIGNTSHEGFEINVNMMEKGKMYQVKFKDSKYLARRNEKDELEVYETDE